MKGKEKGKPEFAEKGKGKREFDEKGKGRPMSQDKGKSKGRGKEHAKRRDESKGSGKSRDTGNDRRPSWNDDPKGQGKFRKGKGRGSDDRSGPYHRPPPAPPEAAREPLRRIRLPEAVTQTIEAGGRLIPRPPAAPIDIPNTNVPGPSPSALSASAASTRRTAERVQDFDICD